MGLFCRWFLVLLQCLFWSCFTAGFGVCFAFGFDISLLFAFCNSERNFTSSHFAFSLPSLLVAFSPPPSIHITMGKSTLEHAHIGDMGYAGTGTAGPAIPGSGTKKHAGTGTFNSRTDTLCACSSVLFCGCSSVWMFQRCGCSSVWMFHRVDVPQSLLWMFQRVVCGCSSV